MPQRVLLYPPTPGSSRGGPHQYSQHLAHPKCTYVSLGRSRHLVSFPGGSAVKDLQETLVPSLGWEDPLQEGVATYSSIMAWEISSAEEPGGLQSMRLSRVRQDLEAKQQQVTLLSCTKCCVSFLTIKYVQLNLTNLHIRNGIALRGMVAAQLWNQRDLHSNPDIVMYQSFQIQK